MSNVELPSVVIYRHTLGRPSEPWIWQQPLRFQSFTPHFLSREAAEPLPSGVRHSEFVHSFRSRLSHGLSASPDAALRVISDREWKPVLVHAHFAFDAAYARRISRRLKIPLIVTLHGVDIAASNAALLRSLKLAWWRLLFERKNLGVDTTFFLCVSEHVRRLARRYFSDSKLRTAFLGVDTRLFEPTPLERSRSILFVGRLVEKKGVQYLLEAFSRVRSVIPDATLTIVGSGPLEGAITNQMHLLGIELSVKHIRRASQHEIISLLGTHRVFCLPSVTARNGDTEGLPISLLEAMAASKPVVSTRHAGIPEAVDDQINGLLAGERDTPALANLLLDVLQNDELAERLGRAARHKVETTFDLSRCALRTEAIYKESLQLFYQR